MCLLKINFHVKYPTHLIIKKIKIKLTELTSVNKFSINDKKKIFERKVKNNLVILIL